jgi:hypothetical protein
MMYLGFFKKLNSILLSRQELGVCLSTDFSSGKVEDLVGITREIEE